MAGDYRKIAINRVCIAEICFRKKDALFNTGKIVLDVDTFDFAGFITGDVIVGYYRNEKYYVYYYYNYIQFKERPNSAYGELEYSCKQYEIELSTDCHIENILTSFTNNTIIFGEKYELTFKNICKKGAEEINRVLQYNRQLLEKRQ